MLGYLRFSSFSDIKMNIGFDEDARGKEDLERLGSRE